METLGHSALKMGWYYQTNPFHQDSDNNEEDELGDEKEYDQIISYKNILK